MVAFSSLHNGYHIFCCPVVAVAIVVIFYTRCIQCGIAIFDEGELCGGKFTVACSAVVGGIWGSI